MNLTNYKTAHELAHDILSKPDGPAVLPIPILNQPGNMEACPVRLEYLSVEGTASVIFRPQIGPVQ